MIVGQLTSIIQWAYHCCYLRGCSVWAWSVGWTYHPVKVYSTGRYFSINSVKSSNEQGFLNTSLTPLFFIWSKILLSDDAVKMTLFFDSNCLPSFNHFITSNPVKPGIAKSSSTRSYWPLRIVSKPSLPSLIILQLIFLAVQQYHDYRHLQESSN